MKAILLTPPGVGAIAVIRLVGAGVEKFLMRHFSKTAQRSRCVYGDLCDGEQIIDDVVVALVCETIADLNVHGGAWLVSRVMELARREGFSIVEPDGPPLVEAAVDGETILEREVQAWLPWARTREAIEVLLAHPAALEAWKREPSLFSARDVLSDRSMHWLLHPPKVAITGAPNVGKSTLANQLFAQERSITANMPGTTRDWVGESANLDGLMVTLVDTPGERETDDAIEREAIAKSRMEIEHADLVVVVFDAAKYLEGRLSVEEMELKEKCDTWRAEIVLNKIDLVPPFGIRGFQHLTVATTGLGLDRLRHSIRIRFGWHEFDLNHPRRWTPRHRRILKRMKQDVKAIAEV